MVQTRSKNAQGKVSTRDDEAERKSQKMESSAQTSVLGETFLRVTTVFVVFVAYIAAVYEPPVDVEPFTHPYSDFTGPYEPNTLLRQTYAQHYTMKQLHVGSFNPVCDCKRTELLQ